MPDELTPEEAQRKIVESLDAVALAWVIVGKMPTLQQPVRDRTLQVITDGHAAFKDR